MSFIQEISGIIKKLLHHYQLSLISFFIYFLVVFFEKILLFFLRFGINVSHSKGGGGCENVKKEC